MNNKKIPSNCPSCSKPIRIEKLNCVSCGTAVTGDFPMPVFLRLDKEDQEFLLKFVKSSGSLKEMARQLGYSYPKVRNMLDDLIKKMDALEKPDGEKSTD
ncbi:MAG: DUF2089 family protein [Saprospirales bacterium]|nr:MAG: DUF2089 family protein [Saprospirales bacterium]